MLGVGLDPRESDVVLQMEGSRRICSGNEAVVGSGSPWASPCLGGCWVEVPALQNDGRTALAAVLPDPYAFQA